MTPLCNHIRCRLDLTMNWLVPILDVKAEIAVLREQTVPCTCPGAQENVRVVERNVNQQEFEREHVDGD